MKTDRIVLHVGRVYRNRNGFVYRCIGKAVTPYSADCYVMRSQKGWVCTAVNVFEQEDGCIFWDFSVDGHWEEDAA